jgi:hypothetical protein
MSRQVFHVFIIHEDGAVDVEQRLGAGNSALSAGAAFEPDDEEKRDRIGAAIMDYARRDRPTWFVNEWLAGPMALLIIPCELRRPQRRDEAPRVEAMLGAYADEGNTLPVVKMDRFWCEEACIIGK